MITGSPPATSRPASRAAGRGQMGGFSRKTSEKAAKWCGFQKTLRAGITNIRSTPGRVSRIFEAPPGGYQK